MTTPPVDEYSNSNSQDYNYDHMERAWAGSLSGMMYRKLQIIAKREGKSISIENKGKPTELYKLGEDVAHLYKRLSGGTVGESNGFLVASTELSEYKHLSWWKEIVDTIGKNSIEVLDPTLIDIAHEAGIEDKGYLFSVSSAMEHYNLEKRPWGERIVLKSYLHDKIRDIVTPIIAPHYKINKGDETMRLRPQTKEAAESWNISNETYAHLLAELPKAITLIKNVFE